MTSIFNFDIVDFLSTKVGLCKYCFLKKKSMYKIEILALQPDLDLVTLDLVTANDLVFCKYFFFSTYNINHNLVTVFVGTKSVTKSRVHCT